MGIQLFDTERTFYVFSESRVTNDTCHGFALLSRCATLNKVNSDTQSVLLTKALRRSSNEQRRRRTRHEGGRAVGDVATMYIHLATRLT